MNLKRKFNLLELGYRMAWKVGAKLMLLGTATLIPLAVIESGNLEHIAAESKSYTEFREKAIQYRENSIIDDCLYGSAAIGVLGAGTALLGGIAVTAGAYLGHEFEHED